MNVDVDALKTKLYEATEEAISRLGINPIEVTWEFGAPMPKWDTGWRYFRDVPVVIGVDPAPDALETVATCAMAMLEEYVARNGSGDTLHPAGLPLIHLDDGGVEMFVRLDPVADRACVRLRMYACAAVGA